MRAGGNPRRRWPGLVDDLELDDAGNVKSYALEYDADDEEGKQFTYRKVVTKDSFSYFKDDSPFTPAGRLSAVEENSYGFIPAVWCKHSDEGEDIGAPAIAGSMGKMDELNSLASHVHDHIDILIESPGVLATSSNKGDIGTRTAATTEDEYSSLSTDRQGATKRKILRAAPDTKWIPMAGNLSPSEAEARIESLYAEIERDHPELKFWETVRNMSSLSGVAVDRLSGDVRGRVGEAAANYDMSSIRLFGMAVAIGGMRLSEGREGWRNPTPQQAAFRGFDLASYGKGDLQMSIMPRPLVPATEAESIELAGKRLANAKVAGEVGYNADKVLEVSGVTDPDERKAMLDARASTDTTFERAMSKKEINIPEAESDEAATPTAQDMEAADALAATDELVRAMWEAKEDADDNS
jgi:hypothetical protein